MKAYCLNNISKEVLDNLVLPNKIVDNIKEADSILVRSFEMYDYVIDDNIIAVARAGAGVNNIPVEKYAKRGIVVFNTPGANANSVKELVVASAILASREILNGVNWVKSVKSDKNISSLVEKNKKNFVGHELNGKTITIVGLGTIGVSVANIFYELGMNVRGYDPFLSISNALRLNKNIKYFENLEESVRNSDFISVHVPASNATEGLINKNVLCNLNSGSIVLNFSRDSLVNENDLESCLKSGQIKKYVTDFANDNVKTFPNTIIVPHLGASTVEAEDNCAIMAVKQLIDYIDNGNITNSVNYPNLNAGIKQGNYRLCINHMNVPGIIASVSSFISAEGCNILNLVNKSNGNFAYTVIDIDGNIDIETIKTINGILRIRTI